MSVEYFDNFLDRRFVNELCYDLQFNLPWYCSNIANRNTYPYEESGTHVLLGNYLYGDIVSMRHQGKYNMVDVNNSFLLTIIDLFEFFLKKLNEKGRLATIAANLQFKGMDGTWHIDGDKDDYEKISLILLLAPEYEKRWDGSFYYKDNNKDKKIDFKSGRLLKLNSNILHKAHAFNKQYKPRFSIKFEYYKI
jgi:hypothetical protein